jgi:uncharacterized protein (TIGR03067 family)
MASRWCLLPLLLCLCSLAFAPAPLQKRGGRKTGDLDRMQGEWTLVESSYEGHLMMRPARAGIVITGNRMTARGEEWTFFVNDRGRPKTFDRRPAEPAEPRLTARESASWGVYRLEGDTLIVYYRHGETAECRPTDDSGRGVYKDEYRRKKK